MPFFVKRLQNNWAVKADGADGATVEMEMEATLLPVFAQLMGPILKRQFNTVVSETIEELKFYIENGRPHPRKIAAMA